MYITVPNFTNIRKTVVDLSRLTFFKMEAILFLIKFLNSHYLLLLNMHQRAKIVKIGLTVLEIS